MNYTRNEMLLKVAGVNLVLDGKPILRDVDFSITNIQRPNMSQGQVVSLIGRSGIGKTQLFKILAGLRQPDSGTVLLGSDQVPVKAGMVGIVPQNYVLFNHRTVRGNWEIAMERTPLSEADKQRTMTEYAEHFGLTEHLDKYPMQLSGGQRQRVSIVQQVLTGNRYILLDEPFSGLDAIMIDRVTDLLLRVSQLHEHNTLIIVSHDIESSVAISDAVYVLGQKGDTAGATITHTYDLCSMGMAWNAEIRKTPGFQRLLEEIRANI
jgi:ABC-type nitrate/sulfonate/bicarbonate transport system ATPase subunit